MKITKQTTLGELAMERVRLNIPGLTLTIMSDGMRSVTAFNAKWEPFHAYGATEAEALDAAFRLVELAGAPDRTPTIIGWEIK